MLKTVAHRRSRLASNLRAAALIAVAMTAIATSGCSMAPERGTAPAPGPATTSTPNGALPEAPTTNPSGTPVDADRPDEGPAAIQEFSILGRTFKPASASVPVNAIGLWVNNSTEDHLIAGPGWQLGPIGTGQAWAHTFKANEAGVVTFRCTIHPEMTGQVTVTPPKN